MPIKLEDTGERMIPEYHKGRNIYGAHITRYESCLPFVKGKVVLDIACGSGYGTKLISTNAMEVFGVDIDKETVEYAKEHYGAENISYVQGSGDDIPLDDNSVDVVVTFETIEHLEDYRKFMKEIKRVLRPEGIVLLSTPNDEEYAEGNEFHKHEFTLKELAELAEANFKYCDKYYQTLWFSSSILPASDQASEWDKPTRTIKTVGLKPEQCVYFVAVCSDKKITTKIQPVSTLGEHYRQRDVQSREEKIKEAMSSLKQQRDELRATLDKILSSRSWKLATAIRGITHFVETPIRLIKKLTK